MISLRQREEGDRYEPGRSGTFLGGLDVIGIATHTQGHPATQDWNISFSFV